MNILAQTQVVALWMPAPEHLRWLAPELALVATIVLVLVVPLIVRRSSYTTAFIVLGGAVVTTLLAYFVTLPMVQARGVGGVTPDESPMLVVDNLSVFFKLFLMLFLVLVTGLWLIGSAEREKDAPEFFVLLLGSALGMSLMVSTLNLLLMVIAIELASLPSYAIAGFDKRNRLGAEASLKYVIFGSACAAIMLYGVSLLYGLYGTLDVSVIAHRMHTEPSGVLAMVALAAVMVGVGFKISAVPFHFWCPDVFEGAKIEVTTWLSVASKAAGLGLLLRLVHAFTMPLAPDLAEGTYIVQMLAWGIGIVAAITCTLGNLAAYRQTSVKRMLAYSSIAHAGYMLMACAVLLAPSDGEPHRAVAAVVAYVLIYMFMNLGAFGTVALVSWATGKETLDAFTGLWRRAPWLAIPMALCLFSLVGMPPMGGFIVKFFLLRALFEGGTALVATKALLYSLVLVAVINTLLSLFYYLRVVKEMFLADDDQPPIEAPFWGLAIVNMCAAVLLLTGTVFADTLRRSADRYAENLYYVEPPRPAAQASGVEIDAEPPATPNGGERVGAATDPA